MWAGGGGRVPEWPLMWCWCPGDDDLGPGNLGGAVDEEIFENGGSEGHVTVLRAVEAGDGRPVFRADGLDK